MVCSIQRQSPYTQRFYGLAHTTPLYPVHLVVPRLLLFQDYRALPSGGPILFSLRSSCRWTSLLPLLAIFVGRTYHHAYSDGGPHKYRHCHPDHEELFPPPLSKSETVLQTFRIPWRQTGGIILIYCFLFDQSQRVGSGRIPPFRCDRQSYDALMTRLLPLGGKDADLGLAGSRFRTSRMW
jgi:hypothetical protein